MIQSAAILPFRKEERESDNLNSLIATLQPKVIQYPNPPTRPRRKELRDITPIQINRWVEKMDLIMGTEDV